MLVASSSGKWHLWSINNLSKLQMFRKKLPLFLVAAVAVTVAVTVAVAVVVTVVVVVVYSNRKVAPTRYQLVVTGSE